MPTPASVVVSAGLAVAAIAHPPVSEIVQRSVAVNARDWKAQDDYSFHERNVRSKVDANGEAKNEGSKTYDVLMICGSHYRRLIHMNNEPLSPGQQREEQAKLDHEVAQREHEQKGEREARVKKYRDQRAEEHLLMEQMTLAFDFRMLGEEDIDGVRCFRLQASPKPDYQPPVEKARVLKGMRGQMWIDCEQFHWVKVMAEVTQPVSFGFFIAKVNPGTRFEIDQAPVDDYWLPKHFLQIVNASVFGVYGYRSQDDSYYSDYRRSVQSNLNAAVR